MNTPISWIKAYVPDLDCTVQEYVDKMTLSGSHVENAVYLDKNLEAHLTYLRELWFLLF